MPNRCIHTQPWNPHSQPRAYPCPYRATHTIASKPTQQRHTYPVCRSRCKVLGNANAGTRKGGEKKGRARQGQRHRRTQTSQSLAPGTPTHGSSTLQPPHKMCRRRASKSRRIAPGQARTDAATPSCRTPQKTQRRRRACHVKAPRRPWKAPVQAGVRPAPSCRVSRPSHPPHPPGYPPHSFPPPLSLVGSKLSPQQRHRRKHNTPTRAMMTTGA